MILEQVPNNFMLRESNALVGITINYDTHRAIHRWLEEVNIVYYMVHLGGTFSTKWSEILKE